MPLIADYCLDAALAKVQEATRLDICHTEPTTYAQATSTYTVGNKTSITVGAVGDATPNGRKVTISAITGGTVTATSTGTSDDAQYFALTDPANSRLIVAGALSAAQMVTNGNTFSLSAFDVRLPDAA